MLGLRPGRAPSEAASMNLAPIHSPLALLDVVGAQLDVVLAEKVEVGTLWQDDLSRNVAPQPLTACIRPLTKYAKAL